MERGQNYVFFHTQRSKLLQVTSLAALAASGMEGLSGNTQQPLPWPTTGVLWARRLCPLLSTLAHGPSWMLPHSMKSKSTQPFKAVQGWNSPSILVAPQSPASGLTCCPKMIALRIRGTLRGGRIPWEVRTSRLQGPDHLVAVLPNSEGSFTRLRLSLCPQRDGCPLSPSLAFPSSIFLLQSAGA